MKSKRNATTKIRDMYMQLEISLCAPHKSSAQVIQVLSIGITRRVSTQVSIQKYRLIMDYATWSKVAPPMKKHAHTPLTLPELSVYRMPTMSTRDI